MPERVVRTKVCPKCGTEIDINRGVCKKCGHMFPWFQVRLYLGGCSVLIALISLTLMAIMAIMGGPPMPPAPAEGAPPAATPAPESAPTNP